MHINHGGSPAEFRWRKLMQTVHQIFKKCRQKFTKIFHFKRKIQFFFWGGAIFVLLLGIAISILSHFNSIIWWTTSFNITRNYS